jgi:hypothetical protein
MNGWRRLVVIALAVGPFLIAAQCALLAIGDLVYDGRIAIGIVYAVLAVLAFGWAIYQALRVWLLWRDFRVPKRKRIR